METNFPIAGRLTISNEFVDGQGPQFSSINPATQESVWLGNAASKPQINLAVESAQSAFLSWSNLDLDSRVSIVRRFTELVTERRDDLAEWISLETGKPFWESLTEVTAVSGKLAPSLEAHELRASTLSRPAGAGESVTRFLPHGVVAVLGPYNFPAHMPNGHIIPALIAGNTVVFKPSPLTPAVADFVVKLWIEAGLPPGVLNVVHGDKEAAQELASHTGVKGVFLTGSPAAGEALQKLLEGGPKKILALELGGNSPLIVWDYANLSVATNIALQSTFITSGQRCSAARRLIIPADDDQIVPSLLNALSKLRIGASTNRPEPFIGPVISNEHANLLLAQQDRLIAMGGVPLMRMTRVEQGLPFLTPGLIDMTEAIGRDDEEVFGPILQVIRVNSFEEAIIEANGTRYGLAAGLVSQDVDKYKEFVSRVDAGVIAWNQQLTGASALAPFGGVKGSGNFHPSGFLAVDYCVKSVGALEVQFPELPKSLPPGLIV